MVNVIKQGDSTGAYVTELVADSVADIANLPTNVYSGSTCICIETSDVYMLNGQKQWKKL